MSYKSVHLFVLKRKNANPATKVFTLDDSNKAPPANVPGRASTKLYGLELARFGCDQFLFFSGLYCTVK